MKYRHAQITTGESNSFEYFFSISKKLNTFKVLERNGGKSQLCA